MVYISSRKDLLDYCEKNNILPEEFNEPVTIGSDFDNKDFHISAKWDENPDNPEITVHSLFRGFTNFNSQLIISEGVEDLSYLLYGAIHFNQPLQIPDSTCNVNNMLSGCKEFNSIVNVPRASIVNKACHNGDGHMRACRYMFDGCVSLEEDKIIIPDSFNRDEVFEYLCWVKKNPNAISVTLEGNNPFESTSLF